MEQWMEMPEYPGYMVSDQGRVARLMSTKVTPSHHHARVNLATKDGRRQVRLVHQLVLEAFVGPRNGAEAARHLDDDPTNNRLENLAWGSLAENSADAFRNGRIKLKEFCPLGHPIKGKNLQKAGRRCKACNQERANAHWHGREFDPERAHTRYKEVMSDE